MKFSIKDLVTFIEEILNGKLHFVEFEKQIRKNNWEPADLVTFTEKILNEKRHFLCSEISFLTGLRNKLEKIIGSQICLPTPQRNLKSGSYVFKNFSGKY